ncbi:MAG: chemotaxis protein CheW [Deltaproteobacteria bacterium]
MTTRTDNDKLEMVAFKTAGQDFCIDIMSVREIRGWVPATVLPHSPGHVLGVINLRGAVVPIIDLSVRLGMGRIAANDRNVIIIVSLGGQTFGLLVEAVSDILGVDSASVQGVPDIADASEVAYVKGIIIGERASTRVLDVRNVLGEEAARVN